MTKMTLAKTLAGGAVSAAMALSPLLTLAAVTQSNDTTGNNSTNRNRSTIDRRVTETRLKRARVTNTSDVTGNTGRNDSSRNTNGGTIKSGKITDTNTLVNTINQSADPASLTPPADVDATQTNSETGNNSTNVNRLIVDDRSELTVTNRARVRNDHTADLNTGRNESSRNTDGGDIDSGDIVITSNITNTIN